MKRELDETKRVSRNSEFEVTHVYHTIDGVEEKFELKAPISVKRGDTITFGSIISHYEDR